MNKKNDKRLCWNCDGSVSLHFSQCPYCGSDLNTPPQESGQVPKSPYGNQLFSKGFTVSDEEWDHALEKESEKEEGIHASKRDVIALLLLLPGVVFLLFGMALFFFSSGGTLTLEWNQNLAYFYFVGAIPLLFLGWRALK